MNLAVASRNLRCADGFTAIAGDHAVVKLEVSIDDDAVGEFPVDPLARGRAEPACFVGVFEQLEQVFDHAWPWAP